ARQGCSLITCARDPAELGRTAVQLREDGADVAAVACDVTAEDAPSRLVVQRLALPAPSGPAGGGGEGTPGQELEPAFSRKAFDRLTALGRTAAARFNERR